LRRIARVAHGFKSPRSPDAGGGAHSAREHMKQHVHFLHASHLTEADRKRHAHDGSSLAAPQCSGRLPGEEREAAHPRSRVEPPARPCVAGPTYGSCVAFINPEGLVRKRAGVTVS